MWEPMDLHGLLQEELYLYTMHILCQFEIKYQRCALWVRARNFKKAHERSKITVTWQWTQGRRFFTQSRSTLFRKNPKIFCRTHRSPTIGHHIEPAESTPHIHAVCFKVHSFMALSTLRRFIIISLTRWNISLQTYFLAVLTPIPRTDPDRI
jgi:hypothetical protein